MTLAQLGFKFSFYVVAHKKLDNDLVSSLTQSLLSARRDLISELPILAQVTAPDTDPNAFLPVHPGAAAFYRWDDRKLHR